MKKLLLLTALGAFVSGLQAQTQNQNPFSACKSEKTTGVSAHEFGASATVITLDRGARLDSLWIDRDGLSSERLTAKPAARKSNIEIGFDFPFAGKTMKYCGLTAAGLVFFGEGDSLAPAVNISNQIGSYATLAGDYVLFQLVCFDSKITNINWKNKPLAAGEDARVRYERVQDTLFIGYENLQGVDKFGNVLTISFQYALDNSGKLSFRPVSMQPQQAAEATTGANYWAYSWAMVGAKGAVFRFLRGDGTSTNGMERIEITAASHPLAGENYAFIPPEPCAAVASPQVKWDYDVWADALQLNPGQSMTWNEEASAALFILSHNERLEGDDLPVDGTVYADGSTVGSSVFVTTGRYNSAYKGNYFHKDKAEGLSADTRYYIHAFPYDEACWGGPRYSTADAPVQPVRTHFKEPASLRALDLTDTSVVLRIDVDAAATRYLLAFDTLQLSAQADLRLDGTRTYAAGDEIAFGERKLRVLEPCGKDAFEWKGLKQGKDYYAYAWSVNADKDWYSRGAALCGVAPVRTLPATMDFASAAVVGRSDESRNLPAGWDEEPGNTYSYALREDASKRKMLSVQNTQALQTGESEAGPSRSAILSPYVDRGENGSVKVTVELVYGAQSGNAMIASNPRTGDTLSVEYQDADGRWEEIASVEGAYAVGQDGTSFLSTESFTPKNVFRLRLTVRSSSPAPNMESETPEDRATPYVGIRAVTLSPSTCRAASDLNVVDGSLSSTGATLGWKDENEIPSLGYDVFYKEKAETEWTVYPVTRARLQLTGLQAGGSYTARVRTYCTDEDSALSSRITFTTSAPSSCGAPSSVRATHLQATSVDLSWKGNASGYAVIYAPREGDVRADTLRTDQTSLALTGLTPNTPYIAHVVSYCGPQYTLPSEPSAAVYFNTPVECTAPELEVVEGSVTWQEVAFAIRAPVPDRQIRIFPKDTIAYPVEYGLTTRKDTLRLYGLIDYENITYVAVARSLCTADTSEWSESVEFTTLPKPGCGAPSNLRAKVEEGGRTASVSWTAGRNNKSWLLMHKEKSVQRYDSLEVREPSSTLYGLKPNTVYTWRVQAACDDSYLYSDLVYSEFSTADASLSPSGFAGSLRVRVDADLIEIENAEGMYLKSLEVISMDGRRLKTYVINASDNVLIPHTLPFGPAVFRITGEGGRTAAYKLMVP